MGRKPTDEGGPVEISVAKWAEACGITVQAANKRIRTLGIPRGPGGGVNPEEAARIVAQRIDVRQQRDKKQAAPAAPPAPPAPRPVEARQSAEHSSHNDETPFEDLNAARLRLESAKADKTQAEADLLLGTVVKTEDVMRTWSSLIGPAKTRLLSIGAKVGPMIALESDAATCQAMIDKAVYEALAEIAEYRPHA